MKLILFLLVFLITTVSFAQTSKQKSEYNFEKDCYSGGQQDANYCLSKAVEKYSRVMNQKYTCILNYLDSQINYYSKSKSGV
jgi:uncharacterized protein YecT (DUF1311 family)